MKHAGPMCVFSILLIFTSFDGTFGGGIGGGAPPVVKTDQSKLMTLKDAARNGEIIRYSVPGSDPIYLQPDIANIKRHSLSAVNIASGNSTVFYANTEADTLQHAFSQNLARTAVSTIPGVLPIMKEDAKIILQPKIEVVSAAFFEEGLRTSQGPEN
ncbi:hypothetical protein [Oligoflexus tunisiensis]|uniref:hypothetical protein n=1 Tax=Oligoflexus tunisiensis TaxID=708132 RepID=UPI00114D13E6|nr:hypothetical protein [Oligoflexus tunisiensis]